MIWFNGLYPQPSSVRRQWSQSSGLGLRSMASVTGAKVLVGVLCAARGTSTSAHSAATPSVARTNRVFIGSSGGPIVHHNAAARAEVFGDDAVCARLGQSKVAIFGHSWGSALKALHAIGPPPPI